MKWLTNILNKRKLAREEAAKIEAAWRYWGSTQGTEWVEGFEFERKLAIYVNDLLRQAYVTGYTDHPNYPIDYNAITKDKKVVITK